MNDVTYLARELITAVHKFTHNKTMFPRQRCDLCGSYRCSRTTYQARVAKHSDGKQLEET